jgi:hypothetical protein
LGAADCVERALPPVGGRRGRRLRALRRADPTYGNCECEEPADERDQHDVFNRACLRPTSRDDKPEDPEEEHDEEGQTHKATHGPHDTPRHKPLPLAGAVPKLPKGVTLPAMIQLSVVRSNRSLP